ncbi:hypothetical protein L1281_001312 [Neisseria sp. HSC-16F19]|nr:hypothetical protein [Neisseria sp. HSC-16F19]MCP2040723.1 hypothetical protein [Neisseria sp. HSC-16F19]
MSYSQDDFLDQVAARLASYKRRQCQVLLQLLAYHCAEYATAAKVATEFPAQIPHLLALREEVVSQRWQYDPMAAAVAALDDIADQDDYPADMLGENLAFYAASATWLNLHDGKNRRFRQETLGCVELYLDMHIGIAADNSEGVLLDYLDDERRWRKHPHIAAVCTQLLGWLDQAA